MTDFNAIKDAFEKAGIETETKGNVKIIEKHEDTLELFAMALQNARKHYLPSERLALSHGFIEISDFNAYNGRYFIKNDKIWIHDIGALKSKLGVILDSELRTHGYDVDTYYSVKPQSRIAQSSYPPKNIINGTYGENMVYLSDGVYIRESECWF